jgi:hypothetical protein
MFRCIYTVYIQVRCIIGMQRLYICDCIVLLLLEPLMALRTLYVARSVRFTATVFPTAT